jgi:hypothetical protein
VGLFGKDKNQAQSDTDWIQPSQILSQLGDLSGPGGPSGTGGPPVPVRLRPLTIAGLVGDWLPGALHLKPGSIQWRPDDGLSAEPVELATATILPPSGTGRKGKRIPVMLTDLETQAGRFQLEMDPVMFDMTKELVAEEAAKRQGG